MNYVVIPVLIFIPIIIHNDILRLYCQNVNGIFDYDGIGLDDAFHIMRIFGADIFTFNKTHGDDTNPNLK